MPLYLHTSAKSPKCLVLCLLLYSSDITVNMVFNVFGAVIDKL